MSTQDKHPSHIRSARKTNSLVYEFTKAQRLPNTSTHQLTNSRTHQLLNSLTLKLTNL